MPCVATSPPPPPPGAMILEFALVLPIFLFLSLGTLVLALGVSQYQAVALLAREGARWASVHGAEYQKTTGKPAATAADVFTSAILPSAATVDPSGLTSSVTWTPDNQPGSTVTVTVNCRWAPQAYVASGNLTSTAVMSVAY